MKASVLADVTDTTAEVVQNHTAAEEIMIKAAEQMISTEKEEKVKS